tara:strand:- start:279 stop:1181 length:903 start_codon:yes stop_codon:yes gene_type:complete
MPDTTHPDPFVGPDAPVVDADAPDLEALARWLREIRGYGAFQMMTRSARRERSTNDPFASDRLWPDLDERLWRAQPTDLTKWSRHPHPGARLVLAAHDCCPAHLLDLLAEDEWPEIRQAALGNNALPPSRRQARSAAEPVDWLREAAEQPEPDVHHRCVRCGYPVKRPDRFLTCSIRCSIWQADARMADGTYFRLGQLGPDPHPALADLSWSWPDGYAWEVAVRPASGGIPGTGPGWGTVLVSFVPGIGAVDCERAVGDLVENQDLTAREAVSVLRRLARVLHGPDVLEVCTTVTPVSHR